MEARLQSAESDDATLIERIGRGDDRAFSQFYRRHADAIARLAHRLLGDETEVDDVVQETFVQAARGLHRLRNPEGARAWLRTVAIRVARRRIGRFARIRELLSSLALTERTTPSRELDAADTLYRALRTLDPDLRIPWVLHRIERWPVPEVAEACGSSPSTIKRRIALAEARLQRRLS